MTEWHTIPAKFSSEEKRILDKLRDQYGLNYNQSLKGGVELLARIIALAEIYVSTNNKTMKKIRKIGNKHNKKLEKEIQDALKSIPIKELEKQEEKLSVGIAKVLTQANDIFEKNRKRGPKPTIRKRGRPKDEGIT